MRDEVRILLLEDSPVDGELVERELKRAGIAALTRRVDTVEAFTSALEEFAPDLILSDNALPSFDALSALRLAREIRPDTGFVVVSGTVGEERAVEMLRSGVTDYVLKHHLERLGPVVVRALAEGEQRRAARAAEESARQANERFRSAFENAPAGMAVIDLSGHLIEVNAALCDLLGHDERDLVGVSLSAFTYQHEETDGLPLHHLADAADPPGRPFHVRFVHRDGHAIWVLLGVSLLRDTSGQPLHVIAQFVDITATKEAEARLRHQALYDPLTGLPNRTLIDDRLNQALSQSVRTGGGVTLLFIDLDHFKVVNDSHGHGAGDVLLVTVAERLRAVIREGDTAGRFGGDEFVIVCSEPGDEGAARLLAARVADTLAAPFWVAGKQLSISASVGIAIGRGTEATAQDLLRNADAAMYRAKELGRARHIVFDDAMQVQAMTRFNVEADLRVALDRGDLVVHYQPQVNLRTGLLDGYEALVRWQHPDLGLIGPDDFVPVAEDAGIITRLGSWVLEQACLSAASWRETRAGLSVCVNVSARQIADPDFVDCVRHVLTVTGLTPSALCLEVTESVLVVASASTTLAINALRRLGVRVSIDDFGTGYASLSYLIQFRPDRLKIDKLFVQGLHDPMNIAISAAVVDLAHRLGLTVVAEGVETQEQLQMLRDLGCDHAQGFLFSEAVPADRAVALLSEQPWLAVRS